MKHSALIFTCEHGGNQVPKEYRSLFAGHQTALISHRGYDPGALSLANRLSVKFQAPLFYSETTRLLIDLNRSESNPSGLFSEFIRHRSGDERNRIIQQYYQPYRSRVEQFILQQTAADRHVLHISVHTFTPQLDGKLRKADIGILYDSTRPAEKSIGIQWQREFREVNAAWIVRRNYPYSGLSDGFVTHLRKRIPPSLYVGIELEVNQKYSVGTHPDWPNLQRDIADSLKQLLKSKSVISCSEM